MCIVGFEIMTDSSSTRLFHVVSRSALVLLWQTLRLDEQYFVHSPVVFHISLALLCGCYLCYIVTGTDPYACCE